MNSKKTPTYQKKIQKSEPEPEPETESDNGIKKDWEIHGWINRTKTGKSFTVSMVNENGESALLGFVNLKQIEKLLAGDISGTPIKCPVE